MRVVYLVIAAVYLITLQGCIAPTTRIAQTDDVAVALEAKKQREIALQSLFEYDRRLQNISGKLLSAAVPLCGEKTRPYLGAFVANKYSFEKDMQDAAAALWSANDVLKVMYAVEGSPAAAGGLLAAGDIPVSVNGQSAPVGEEASKRFQELLSEQAKQGNTLQLKILRNDREQTISVTLDKTCDYPVILGGDDALNAYADGQRIVILKGLMRFFSNDNEIAMIVAHELAHNVMKHIDAQRTNYMIGSIFDILAAAYGVNTQGLFGNAAALTYSKEFEAEADYVGLYIMARAGLPIDDTPHIWRRMAAEHPTAIGKAGLTASHPATPERFVGMEKAIQEIKDKQAKNLPLTPELKDASSPTNSAAPAQ
ncbi:MAG: M48 family metallopeptidase [Pseudomonadota bacterium]